MIQRIVLEAIEKRPMTVRAISECLHLAESQVRAVLGDPLRRKGWVVTTSLVYGHLVYSARPK